MRSERLKYLREILRHPANQGEPIRTLVRYLGWNVGRRLLGDAEFAIRLVAGRQVILSNKENYATLAFTCGLYDFEDMLFVLHFLRAGDVFGDFGANVGLYSVLAGIRDAKVLAVEPVPDTFVRLKRNLAFNGVSGVPLNCGLSDHVGTLSFTTQHGGMNRVVRKGETATIEVGVATADVVAEQAGLAPNLLKIDVEGFEYPLLSGGRRLLQESVQVIIIELNGSGRRYGFADEDVDRLLVDAGFGPFAYDPLSRTLSARPGLNRRGLNTLYVREDCVESAREKLRSAPAVEVPIHGGRTKLRI
jgi:FkbM family methyltransferase